MQYIDGGNVEVHVYLSAGEIDLLRRGTLVDAAPQPSEKGNVIRVQVGPDRRTDTTAVTPGAS